MTCMEYRSAQLDELKNGLDEVVYHIDVLRRGSFAVTETLTFSTMDEANKAYNIMIHNGYCPGFLRKYATVVF